MESFMVKVLKLAVFFYLSFAATGCALKENIFDKVRRNAKHVKQVTSVPSSCISLGEIKLHDFYESDNPDYNRNSFINYFANITKRRDGDTFRVLKKYKTEYAPDGFPKEIYLNGIAEAYRCDKKENFVFDKKWAVHITEEEPKECEFRGETTERSIYIDDAETNLRASAVTYKANTIFIKDKIKHYNIGTKRGFYESVETDAHLYSCRNQSQRLTSTSN